MMDFVNVDFTNVIIIFVMPLFERGNNVNILFGF